VGDQANPPFAISRADLEALLARHGEGLEVREATRSHPRRLGRELLWVARRR
jgi:hypothetical protein